MGESFLLQKMQANHHTPIDYYLNTVNGNSIYLNNYLEQKITLTWHGKIQCLNCNRDTKKSFNQGYCYPCFSSLARCDMCQLKPELCHYDQGTCREPKWGEEHCIIPHTIYLANSSAVKVGITRSYQQTKRWIDQGASTSLVIGQVKNRHESGIIEVNLKNHVNDKTNWRKMLKGEIDNHNLLEWWESLKPHWGNSIKNLIKKPKLYKFNYPVKEYPTKIVSHNLEKTPILEGVLLGIKGQYLILDCAVINIRKYTGYLCSLTV